MDNIFRIPSRSDLYQFRAIAAKTVKQLTLKCQFRLVCQDIACCLEVSAIERFYNSKF